jgi:hypothetical protein
MRHVGMLSAESYLNISHSRHPFKFLLQVEILHRLVLHQLFLDSAKLPFFDRVSVSYPTPYALFHNHTRPRSRPRLCLFCPHRLFNPNVFRPAFLFRPVYTPVNTYGAAQPFTRPATYISQIAIRPKLPVITFKLRSFCSALAQLLGYGTVGHLP